VTRGTAKEWTLASKGMGMTGKGAAARLAMIGAMLVTGLQPAIAAPEPARIAIRGATIIDVVGGRDIEDGVVLVDRGRIVSVGTSAEVRIPPGTRIIEAKGRYMIPGIIDAHVHFFQSGGLFTRPDAIDLRSKVPYADEVASIRAHLPDTLRAYVRGGVTGAVDMGGPNWNFEVRAKAAADPIGPHVWVAGPLLSPYQPQALVIDADPPILKTASAEDARAQARAQIAHKPDFLKFWYVTGKDGPAGARDRLQAMVAEADKARIRVAVHATQLETARVAVAEGADVLVHSVEDKPIDDAFIAAMKQKGTVYIPTLIVNSGYGGVNAGENVINPLERIAGQPEVVKSFEAARTWQRPEGAAKSAAYQAAKIPVMAGNLARVFAAGIPVAMGTDAGNIGTLHVVSVAEEMGAMADAGLPARAVLASATIVPARMVGRDKDLGSIAPGKVADLVLLRDDPRRDVRAVATVDAVIRGGVPVEGAGLPDTPEAVVQRQLEAYNRGDVEAFAATYAEDVELFDLGADPKPTRSGRAALVATYGPMLARLKPQAAIASRTVTGSFVTDHERVTVNGNILDAVAVYQVEKGLIRRVWFAQ
jgi:imidazolonepropionase-like amidohydrolase